MIDLHADEKILLAERRHWLPVVFESISIFALAIAPFFFLIGAEFLPLEAHEVVGEYRGLAWFLYSAWLFGLWMAFAVFITNYYLDVLFVTTKRVVDVEQKGLFARDVAEVRLENIQDVHVEVKGLIASLLRYGSLSIQSSAESREFVLNQVHDPDRIRETISRAHDAVKSSSTTPASAISPAAGEQPA